MPGPQGFLPERAHSERDNGTDFGHRILSSYAHHYVISEDLSPSSARSVSRTRTPAGSGDSDCDVRAKQTRRHSLIHPNDRMPRI